MAPHVQQLHEFTEQAETDLQSISKDKVQFVDDKLQYYQAQIDTRNSQIIAQISDDDEEIEAEVAESQQLQSDLFDSIQAAEALVQKLSVRSDGHVSVSDRFSDAISRTKLSVKLPKLELQSFAGDPMNWQEFWDSFKTTIHDNSDLADIDKFKYLKSFFAKDALHVIDGFRLTSSNYLTVIETLQERYGNPELAIFAHFERLLEMPPGDDHSGKLRDIYDECEKHIRSLVALGLSEETFGQVFTPIILFKLPRNVRLQLHRLNRSCPWKLSNLRELLKDEIKARTMSDRYSSKSSGSFTKGQPSSNSNSNKGFKGMKVPQTQGALANESKNKSNKSTIQCCFCSEAHYADQCTQFKTADERRAQLKGKCYKCLGSNHQSNQCKHQVSCYYCKKNSHHSSLCNQKFGKAQSTGNSKSVSDQGKDTSPKDSTLFQEGQSVYLQMAIAYFSQSNVQTRILFDTGSFRSYITTALSNSLGLPCLGQDRISAAQFGGKKRKNLTYNFSEIPIPVDNLQNSVTVTVLVTDQITCPLQKYRVNTELHPIITQILLADPLSREAETVSIDILIGADHYCDFIGTERISLGNGLFLLESKLGYIVIGKVCPPDSNYVNTAMLFRQSFDVEKRIFDVEKFWSLEDIGVKDDPYQADDDRALQLFNDTVRLVNDRYEVTWPWKDTSPELPSNFNLAFRRLKSLMSKIQNQEVVIQQYRKVITDQLDKGIVEVVPRFTTEGNLLHYLPHHCVIRNDKATIKLRVVYDASAKASKTSLSLNECLLRGPVILQDLCGMLARFRLSKFAMTSDGEKAFLQVGLQEKERDVTRLLWPKDSSEPITNSNLIVYRFCRVPFGVISSPFLLSATIKHRCIQISSKPSNDIAENIYVDNVLAGRNTISDAVEYYQESKQLFQAISMNIREWYCNSLEVVSVIQESDKGKDPRPKVLGLTWELDSDSLSCSGINSNTVTKPTKCSILQVLSSCYDPCGYFTPVTVREKLLVQDLWKNKLSWDAAIPGDVQKEFSKVHLNLEKVKEVKIPRLLNSLVHDTNAVNELHCFCDASCKAYATVAYLRSSVQNGSVRSDLLFSKVRLASIKGVSLPRLELMAVVIGGRLSMFLVKDLEFPLTV